MSYQPTVPSGANAEAKGGFLELIFERGHRLNHSRRMHIDRRVFLRSLQCCACRSKSLENTKAFAAWLAERFVEGYPSDLAHACHAASAGFFKSWQASRPPGLPGTVSVTVGSVRFKGRALFETTRAAIAELVHTGRASGTDVPVHVWLTLDDLTVVDLTIISTLIKYGELPPDTPPVLFWRDDCSGDFTFEPILVDNLFFERIDSGIFTMQVRN